jgi:DNA-binding CsgD family transcriptional regulator
MQTAGTPQASPTRPISPKPVRPSSPAIAPGLRSANHRDERAVLDQMLADARLGVGGSLVLRGESGSGKTSLLTYAVEHAAEFRVIQVTGVQPESELGFAALHGLLTPFSGRLDHLPGPQRDALGTALGLVTAATPDRFLVGLAVLSLLTQAAKDRPVLLAIDDAHWLDEATADVLAFAARRLTSMPVAFAIAVRESTTRVQSLDGLPPLQLATIPRRHESASSLAGTHSEDSTIDSSTSVLASGCCAAGELTILDLGNGRYPEALSRALAVFHEDPPELGTQILPDLIEAAVRSGDMDAAASALERLCERTRSSRARLASGLLARSKALMADDADALYREAIEHLRQSDTDVNLARAHLLYGEWLRRRRRRRDAREQLRAARELFDNVGFPAFAHRASVELRATSEAVQKRRGARGEGLTSQEAEIARLVAEGSSNRQVAAQLFISQNTVEYHLQKVFRKIGVGSRTQLARAIHDQSRGDEARASRASRNPGDDPV